MGRTTISAALVATVVALSSNAAAARCEHANVTFSMSPDSDPLFESVEEWLPGAIPNGLFYYQIYAVSAGSDYSLSGGVGVFRCTDGSRVQREPGGGSVPCPGDLVIYVPPGSEPGEGVSYCET